MATEQFFDDIELMAGACLRVKTPDDTHEVVVRAPAGITGDVEFALPSTTGTEGQVLGVGPGGTTQWVTPRKFAVDWLPADGNTKTIAHNLGTRDLIVQLYDPSNGATIGASVDRTDENTVVLGASMSPTGNGWRVLGFAV